jgi:Protein of unknown function DUF2620
LIRINVGGLAAKEIGNLAAQVGGDQVDVRVGADITGAQEVAQGKADYYLGACATGGGGALAMAIAILGYSSCFTASTAGKPPKEEEIHKAVQGGKKAFGFTSDHMDRAVPMIVNAILANHRQDK